MELDIFKRLKNFDEIQSFFKENNITGFSDNFKFKKNFKRSGKQGIVGLFEYISPENKKTYIVFKLSLYINYLVEHESKIMKDLLKVKDFCHNFCHNYGSIEMEISPEYKTSLNPFFFKRDKIMTNVLLMEYLENCKKFYFYVKEKSVPMELVFSQIKQTLCAIHIAQQNCKFSHYDLHSNNVLLKECDPNTLFLYALDEEHQFLVPSYGYYPIIIDFGFSYSGGCEKTPLHGALAHTDVGFMSSEFDELADPRLFLVTLSTELENYRPKDPFSKKFRRIVKDLFHGLKIDWESGWDKDEEVAASDYVSYMLEDDMKHSSFFESCGHYCTDIIQGLIELPLKKRRYENISENFQIFYNEFEVIEELIVNDYYLLYIFKKMTDFAMKHKADYLNEETRKEAVKQFKYDLFTEIVKIAKFANPKLNYEKLLCSLILLAKNTEGILYDAVKEKLRIRNAQKEKLKIKNVLDIIPTIDYNFSDSYTLSKKCKIVVIDNIKKSMYDVKLSSSQIDELNRMDEIFRGFFIYQQFIN